MSTAVMASPMAQLQALRQSVWMDTMSRRFLDDGVLKRLIDEDGLQGVTSNPTIFEKAIAQGHDYDDQIKRLAKAGADDHAIYDDLTRGDVAEALDLFLPTYEASDGVDGVVSLEVSPLLAHDSGGTLAEAKRLWAALDRPNAMIKIPGTTGALPAIEEAIFAGINVNVTLLFSVPAYEAVARAYVKGLQRRADEGLPIDRIASVASFFVSRIDAEVEKRLKPQIDSATGADREALLALLGTAAIANAKNAYRAGLEVFEGGQFTRLRAFGARPQRLLWASVGMKKSTVPGFSLPDTLYIDQLIGPETVSTMPPETYDAFKDHGTAAEALTQGLDEAPAAIAAIEARGVDFADVTETLLEKGVESFSESFRSLMASIASKRAAVEGA